MACKFTITSLERKNGVYLVGADFLGIKGMYEVRTNGSLFWNKYSTELGFMICDWRNRIPDNGDEDVTIRVRGTNSLSIEREAQLERALKKFACEQAEET